jgi:hypothetical protein
MNVYRVMVKNTNPFIGKRSFYVGATSMEVAQDKALKVANKELPKSRSKDEPAPDPFEIVLVEDMGKLIQ